MQFDDNGHPQTTDGWDVVEEKDYTSLVHILWRFAMPGWSPITEDHPDWDSYREDAERIVRDFCGWNK